MADITRRERSRLLAYLDRLQKARERGHRMWLAHANCLIEQTITGKPAAGHLDRDEMVRVCVDLKEAASDLDAHEDLLRPLLPREDWARAFVGWANFERERACIHAGQRKVIRDQQAWEAEVIKPMQEHHAAAVAGMEALRRRLGGAAPRGEPGAPRKYPKTLKRAIELRRRGVRGKDLWDKCKKKSEEVGECLPGMKSFLDHVRRCIREGG